ncbi:MAG: 50S ribosome-binding GTPase [Acidaminococcaceae bacterium]|nr:50S ribosome-binding GTPase [Acidaminococcaceae bacterium]MDD4721596.1 50S ribosome-binding GTPase [Acidaminococcaceae bacterium]
MTGYKAELREKIAKIVQEKVKIAFFGQPGAGKSSTINAICGAEVAKVGVTTDTTRDVQIIKYGEVIFVDLPGYGTSRFPQNEFFTKFNPLQYDLFVCVFAGKLHEADTKFFQELNKRGKPCIFVRNKTDEIYDEGKTLEQSQESIRQDVARQLGTSEIVLQFISARGDMHSGIEALNACITSKMGAARKEKYIMAVKTQTKEHLQQKRALAIKYVSRSAKFAAVNGLNPILGVDFAIDITIIYNMYEEIRQIFAIDEKNVGKSTLTTGLKNYLLKGMSKEGIAIILKSVTQKIAARSMLKYIPLVGQAATVYVGHKIVEKAGEDYVRACYQVAEEELLDDLKLQN